MPHAPASQEEQKGRQAPDPVHAKLSHADPPPSTTAQADKAPNPQVKYQEQVHSHAREYS